jgi:hypothetical protein
MDLEKMLAVLKEVHAVIDGLNAMGIKVNGTIDLPTILRLVGVAHP